MPTNFILPAIQRLIHRLRFGIRISNADLERRVERISQRSALIAALSDGQIRSRLKQIAAGTGSRHNTDIDQALALAREAAERTLGMRPFDVQILAALGIDDGNCVEMQTGEGKTLAAALAACLRALSGRGVHILTFNDYLAKRDACWMRPLYQYFDLSVGYIEGGMSGNSRREAYGSDITYVTAREAGFDFLRDNLCTSSAERVQRGFSFAIIDEADSILIDEARIPLVIATESQRDDADLMDVAQLVRTLGAGVHFQIKAGGRNISLTEHGLRRVEAHYGIGELHSEEHSHRLSRVNQALHAQYLLSRDKDYIVRDGRLELIDEFTGRVADNRKWPGGLQAALEAKEHVCVEPEGRILKSITLLHFLESYDQLSGMTGTAAAAAEELNEFYRMPVRIVPPNRPCIRIDQPDRIFNTQDARDLAVTEEIVKQHAVHRPVLVGTASVNESATLARCLQEAGVPCQVLNAANDFREAEIIAEAGSADAVTISTNMAGRGTDIRLGGSTERSRDVVLAAGGLYVIGTHRHESRRIDDQLRGRAGRQGDPGESRFFISLQDHLLARHGVQDLIASPGHEAEITDETTAAKVAHLQRIIDGQCFEIRRTLKQYSGLLEIQRRRVTEDRNRLLDTTTSPCILWKEAPELYDRWVGNWGRELVEESERQVMLRHLDWCWSDHLVHATELRDGIHLVSLGGFNAFDTFNREMNLEFRTFRREFADRVIETMSTATFTNDGIQLGNETPQQPSATWTFMINDNPGGSVLDQLTQGVARQLRKTLSRSQ